MKFAGLQLACSSAFTFQTEQMEACLLPAYPRRILKLQLGIEAIRTDDKEVEVSQGTSQKR